ncbi:NUDIX hydrolase domain-like protein [Crassisporium funariophilum]|nr:NUDIX hydrolase domain-like protein [Crassisporium funariophilum]
MSASKVPTTQYLAGNFIVSAGCVLFRRNPASTNGLETCILHQTVKNEWLLPKGRKDRGETIEEAAVRETYEETGYACHLWPQRMPTRAPAPGVNNVHVVEVLDGLVEPIAITIRDLGHTGVKFIWWYIALVESGIQKVEGSQMEDESFESVFLNSEVAMERLTFQSDRDIVKKALEIVLRKGS